MLQNTAGPRYLMRWDHHRSQRLGQSVVDTTHRLSELTLFSDEGLAMLLDRYPRRHIHVWSTGTNPCYPNQQRYGRLGLHCGRVLVDQVRRGRLCLQLRHLSLHSRQLGRIVGRLFSELTECQPGLRTFDQDGVLEISSPRIVTYFRYDAKPNLIWLIRGRKECFHYPADDRFLPQRTLEAEMAAAGPLRPLYYEPAYDRHANRLTLRSGDMLGLPQHTPFRLSNGNDLCVCLTTDYLTSQADRVNRVYVANGLLNRVLPWRSGSTRIRGPVAALKRAVSRIAKRRPPEAEQDITFCIDPASPGAIGPIESEDAGGSCPPQSLPPLFVDPCATVGAPAGERAMLRIICLSPSMLLAGLTILSCTSSAADRSAESIARQAIAPDPHHVMGNDACVKCHAAEIEVWKKTPHARTFDELHRRPEAKQIAKKLGLKSIKHEGRCTSCHYTRQAKMPGGDLHTIAGRLL